MNVSRMGLNKLKCSNCQNKSTKVLDSRPIENGKTIRRRRECENCGFRFTTFERIDQLPLIVIKKDGTREEYNREKLIDRKSTRLNSSHVAISYAVFCLKKKNNTIKKVTIIVVGVIERDS